jgi:hypothetical protein
MTVTTETVLNEALSLPERERALLVEKLLSSLYPDEGSPEIEAAWKQEVRERCRAADAGLIEEIDAADVYKDVRRKLK